MPRIYDVVQQEDEDKTPVRPPSVAPLIQRNENIRKVDEASGYTLPTEVVLHLAGLGRNDRELARLGRVFARNFSIDPKWLFGDTNPKNYTSPITGEPISAREARIFTNNFGIVPITSMLPQYLTVTEGETYKGVHARSATEVQLDPKRVGRFARIIADAHPDMPMLDAMGQAALLTRQGVDPRTFAQNLDLIQRWGASYGQDMDYRSAFAFAAQTAAAGTKFRKVTDVQEMLFPGVQGASDELRALIEKQQAAARAQGIDPDSAMGQMISPEVGEANVRRAAILRGSWTDGNGKPITAAEAAGDPNAVWSGPPIPTLGKIGDFDSYWQDVQDEAQRIALDQDAFENSLFNKLIIKPAGWTLREMGTLYNDFFAGAVMIARIPVAGVAAGGAALGLDPQGDSAAANWEQVMAAGRYQAQRLYIPPSLNPQYGAETPGTLIAEPLGDDYKHWVGPGLDFIIGWKLDPLVLAGRARTAYLSDRLLPGLLSPGGGRIGKLVEAANEGAVAEWITKVDDFAASSESRRLFNVIDDAPKYNRQIYRMRGVVEARGTLDLPFMTALRERLTFRFGLPDDVLTEYRNLEARTIAAERRVEAATGGPAIPEQGMSWKEWSRQRGYTEAEIKDFDKWLKLNKKLGLDVQSLDDVTATGIARVSDETIQRAAKALRAEGWQAWQDGIKAHFYGQAPEGSVAAEVVNARLNEGFRARQVVDDAVPVEAEPPLFYEHNGQFVPENVHQEYMADAMKLIEAQHPTSAFPGWLRVEIPGSTRLAEYGPRRLVRSAITSERFTETALGKRLARIPSMNPGRVLDFNGDPTRYIYEHSTRWGVFNEAENQIYAARTAEILNSGRGIEAKLGALVDEINDAAWDKLMTRYNLDPEAAATMKQELFEPAVAQNKTYRQQVFGAVDDKPVTTPIMESQLRNQLFVIDPIEVEKGIRHYITMRDRLYSQLMKVLKRDMPELTVRFERTATVKALDAGGSLFQDWLRFWKGTTVARPAYIGRVILIDENARFLATTQSLTDRLLSIGWGHRGAENPNKLKQVVDDLFGADLKVGDDVIDVPRAGAFEYEAAAGGQVRQSDAIAEMMRGHDNLYKSLKNDAGGSWDILRPTEVNQTQHINAWTWDLTKHLRNSEPGQIALSSVANGGSIEDTKTLLIQWAKRDNYTTLRSRMGIGREDVDEWADQLAKVTHSYTLDMPDLATLALEGNPENLQLYIRTNIPVEARPVVHGPTVMNLTDGVGGTWTKFVNKLYDWFVRQPEDSLNRQPFYSVWRRRAEVSMYKALEAQGIDVSVNGIAPFRVPGRTGIVEPAITEPALLGNYSTTVRGDDSLIQSAVRQADEGSDFAYHTTPETNLQGIAKSGLTPSVPPEGGDPAVFFADSPRNLTYAAPHAGRDEGQAVLRIKLSAIEDGEFTGAFPGEGFVEHAIHPSDLEVLGADGKWHSLSTLKRPASELAPHAAVGDADGFVYHISPPENLDSIRQSGLKPTVTTLGPNAPAIAKKPRLFFADSLDDAKRLAHGGGEKIALRVKASEVGTVTPEELFPGSQFIYNGIPMEKLEVLTADGSWHPLVEAGKYVPYSTKSLIENAARDFALGQVKRVMFDFTKQSRFTELLQYVFPFPQPFFEGFQAWGHIAYRNPTALVHGKQLFDLGVRSGFIKKDPLSGEYMVPAGAWKRPLIELASLGFFGADPKLMEKLDTPWMPLSNMNMLSSSTLKFGAEGPLGAAIGGVPLPVPGMHPPIQYLMSWAAKDSTSPVAQGYLYQFGPSVVLLPRPVKAVVDVLFPNASKDESSQQSLRLSVLAAMQATGMDRDENGNLIPVDEQERQRMVAAGIPVGGDGKTLTEMANDTASGLIRARGIVGLFAPTQLRTAFEGQRADYSLFQETLDRHGGDFAAAVKEWYVEHPDKPFVPAGKTLADVGYGEGYAVRVPPSELVYQMYRMDGIGQLMRDNPQWAALMLVGTDPEVQSEQNFMAFADLVNKGLVRYKTPAEYYGSAVDGPGWEAYNHWQQQNQARLDAMAEKYGSIEAAQNRDEYRQYTKDRQEFFNTLYQDNPRWVLAHLTYSEETKSWDWPVGYDPDATAVQAALGDARRIAEMPGLEGFPGVQALRDYIELRDGVETKMKEARITDINSSRAEEEGLQATYLNGVTKLAKDTPEFTQFLSKYFDVSFDDEGNAISTSDLVFNTTEREWLWSEIPKTIRDQVADFDANLYIYRNKAREESMSDYERSQFYAKADNLLNDTYREHPEIVKAWWTAQGHSAQMEYKEYAATKPIAFWTPFDFEQLAGIKLSKRAQGWMKQWAEARLTIARLEDADPNYSSSSGYDQINAHIHELLKKKDVGFRKAVEAQNTWGWTISNVLGLGKPDADGSDRSEADWVWRKFLDLSRQAQKAVEARGWLGIDYGSEADRKAYREAQRNAATWVTKMKKHNPAFKEEWEWLTELNGDPIIGSLVLPDNYFGPAGSLNYGD